MRSEAYFIELVNDSDSESVVIREHWQCMMPDDLFRAFPHLELDPSDKQDEFADDLWDDDELREWPPIKLPNGKEVDSEGGFELVEYEMSVNLNEIGEAWIQTLGVMEDDGFLELDELGGPMVSVAPWRGCDV